MSISKAFVVVATVLVGFVASATTYTWDTSVTEGEWTDPNCWTAKSGCPSTTDTAVFPAAMNARVTLSGDVAIAKLTLQGGTSVIAGTEGATLKITSNLEASNNTTIEFTDGLVVTVPQFRFRGGSNKHLTLSNGAKAYVQECNLDNGSEFTIDNARLQTSSNNWLPYGNGAISCTIRFKGKNPVWYNSGTSAQFGINGSSEYGDYVFEIPVGGFAEPPLQTVSGANAFGVRSAGTTGSLRMSVDPDSPAFAEDCEFDQTLVAWSAKGVNSTVVVPGTTSPKAGNSVAINETNVVAHLVGYRDPGALCVVGEPVAFAAGGLPAYGVTTGHAKGEEIVLKAPAAIETASEKGTCLGWRVSTCDEATGLWTAGEFTAGTKCSFTYSGAYTKVEWFWDVACLVTAASSGHGTIEPAGQWVKAGEPATFTITGALGYGFGGFTGGVTTAEPTFTVLGPTAVTVNFSPVEAVELEELDYVDSNGTQYFDTGFIPDGNKVWMEMEYDFLSTVSGENWVMSVLNGGLNWRMGINNGAQQVTCSAASGYDGYIDTYGDHKVTRWSNINTASSIPCYLCAQNNSGKLGCLGCNVRVYSCKFGNADGTARDFVPCRRTGDSTPGLLDRAGSRFYESLGTGALSAGAVRCGRWTSLDGLVKGTAYTFAAPADFTDAAGNVRSAIGWTYTAEDGTEISGAGKTAVVTYECPGVIRWKMYSEDDRSGFVDEYQPVEYIESTGVQWIDTGVIPADTSCACEIKFKFTSLTSGENWAMSQHGGGITWRVGETSRGATTYNGSWTVVESGDWKVATATTCPGASTKSCYLFCQHGTSGTDWLGSHIRIASCKFWQSGELIRDFVPCFRRADSRAGLYDRVSHRFYADARMGLEDFAVGPKVDSFYADVGDLPDGFAVSVTVPDPEVDPQGGRRSVVTGADLTDATGAVTHLKGNPVQFDYAMPSHLEGTYQNSFRVTAVSHGHGTITPAEQWVVAGERASFAVAPDDGYFYYGLDANGEIVRDVTSLQVDEPLAVTGCFSKPVTLSPTGDRDDAVIQAVIDGEDFPAITLTAGEYEFDGTVFVTNAVTLVNSGEVSIHMHDGNRTNRLFVVDNPNAVLSGLDLVNKWKIQFVSPDNLVGAAAIYLKSGTVRDCRLDGFITAGIAGTGRWGSGVYMAGGTLSGTTIANGRTIGAGGRGYLYVGDGVVTNCDICGGTEGTGSVWLEDGLIVQTKIHDNVMNAAPGLYQTGGTAINMLIYSNKLKRVASQAAGIHKTGGNTYNCTVWNNVIVGDTAACAGLLQSKGETKNCLFWQNGEELDGRSSVSVSGGTFDHNLNDTKIEGNFDGDPLLRNPTKGDFRLRPRSSCVDKGENMGWMAGATDFIGQPRVRGAAVDIGCCEWQPSGLILILR